MASKNSFEGRDGSIFLVRRYVFKFTFVGEPASSIDSYQMGDLEGVSVYPIPVRVNQVNFQMLRTGNGTLSDA